ncbi:hypothetical protein D6745_00225 [Candidatus Woesearchaeota archaeon]|nr:MAG: hypothetical protein D6745_00225 [Candidatus Woesearchaeota archaeon]
MIRVCLIGPGDAEWHFHKLLGMTNDELNEQIMGIAGVLAKNAEIVLLPDRGICFEIAKMYKKLGGRKVLGTVPLSDKDFGIKHLKNYMEAEVSRKKVFDEFIDTDNWYKQDLTHCLFGDVVLMLGNSLGSIGELAYGFYLYKLFVGKKPEVKARMKAIHPEARAGRKIPYSVIVYKPFVKGSLSLEVEEYVKRIGGKIFYVSSAKELEEVIKELRKAK